MNLNEHSHIRRAEFVEQVKEQTKRDVGAMQKFQHTWALQQLLAKREWLRR